MATLLSEINCLSGQHVELCYPCHKCTAGCPVVEAMDYGPGDGLPFMPGKRIISITWGKSIARCSRCAARPVGNPQVVGCALGKNQPCFAKPICVG